MSFLYIFQSYDASVEGTSCVGVCQWPCVWGVAQPCHVNFEVAYTAHSLKGYSPGEIIFQYSPYRCHYQHFHT